MSESTIGQDAISQVAKLALEAHNHSLEAVRIPGEPPDVYYLFNKKTGKYERQVADSIPTNDVAFDLTSLVDRVKRGGGGNIYYSREKIIGEWKDDKRTYRCALALNFQQPFRTLMNQASSTPRAWTQKEFINLMRTQFPNVLPAPTIAALRKMKWENVERGGGAVASNTDDGFDVEVRNSIKSDGGTLPEKEDFNIGVFDLRELREKPHIVECAFDFDSTVKPPTITLTPLANSIEYALQEAMDDVAKALAILCYGGEGEKPEDALIHLYHAKPVVWAPTLT